MQIILAGPYPAGTAEKFGQLLPGNEIVTVTDQAEYEAMTEGDVIVVRVLKTPASVLAPKKDLKAVIRWGTGYDSVDIEAAGKTGCFRGEYAGCQCLRSCGTCSWTHDRSRKKGDRSEPSHT